MLERNSPAPNFLESCLQRWPAAHALLRSIELRKLWRFQLAAPILDIGCGDGVFTRLLFNAPLEVGLDLQTNEIRRAQFSNSHKHLLVSSATHLPLPTEYFASVFSNCVLEHIDGLDNALREISRVLQPGGVLLATVPTPRWESDGPIPLFRRLGWHRLSEKLNSLLRNLWHHVTVDDQEGWRKRLDSANLQLLEWEPYMVPRAYAAYSRFLFLSVGSFVMRRLTGRWLLSCTLRKPFVPLLSRCLRRAYLAEDSVGACALFAAVKRHD